MINLSQASWRKSSRSGQNNGACVEIADNIPGVIALRDSKCPAVGAHVVDRTDFAAFLADLKAGYYDR